MHGLVNRSIQAFLRDTHGEPLWQNVAAAAGLRNPNFEALLHYDDIITSRMIRSAATTLNRPAAAILEDMGQWMIASSSGESLRRLLRFGGVTFTDFLHSLEDLPGRARLALPDVTQLHLTLREHPGGNFRLTCSGLEGFGYVMIGALQAMADDYGALVLIEHRGVTDEGELIALHLHATDYSHGREFSLVGAPL